MLTETRKGVDEIIAQCFPEYAHKSVEIAWNAIYDFIKAEETPTSTYVNNKKSGVIEIELHHGGEDGSDRICGKFGLRRGKKDKSSLLAFKNHLDSYYDSWELVGKFKP